MSGTSGSSSGSPGRPANLMSASQEYIEIYLTTSRRIPLRDLHGEETPPPEEVVQASDPAPVPAPPEEIEALVERAPAVVATSQHPESRRHRQWLRDVKEQVRRIETAMTGVQNDLENLKAIVAQEPTSSSEESSDGHPHLIPETNLLTASPVPSTSREPASPVPSTSREPAPVPVPTTTAPVPSTSREPADDPVPTTSWEPAPMPSTSRDPADPVPSTSGRGITRTMATLAPIRSHSSSSSSDTAEQGAVGPVVRRDETRLECRYCNALLKNRTTLERHIRNKHFPQQQFQCNVCNFQTKYKYNYTEHMRAHSDERFRCEHCDYQTAYRGKFKEHSKKHRE